MNDPANPSVSRSDTEGSSTTPSSSSPDLPTDETPRDTPPVAAPLAPPAEPPAPPPPAPPPPPRFTTDTERAADATRRSSAPSQSGQWIAGVIMIVVGALFLFGQLVPDIREFIVLVVGLALLAIFLATRAYGALVPGGIVSGVGFGVIMLQRFPENGFGLFMLSLAFGFVLVFLLGLVFRVPENSWWPLIPAFFIAITGIAATVNAWMLITQLWPIVLILAGLLVIVRSFVVRR